MIVGVDFFSKGFDGNVYDTPIPTSEMDEVIIGTGMYDELFVSVDTTIDHTNIQPDTWEIKTIMDAKFNNSIEAGTIDGAGHIVTNIQMYRRKYRSNDDWQLVAAFPYEQEYNVYTVIDRFVENGQTYEYCIVPLAKDTIGDITKSQPVLIDYDGSFVSDLDNNFKMSADFEFGELSHNKNSSVATPLNSAYPIVSFGNQNYRSGTIKYLPLTDKQLYGAASAVNARDERLNRKRLIDFLNNGKTKVIRRDDGDMIVCVTSSIKSTPKATSLDAIADVSFELTEIGELNYNTMEKAGLIARAGKSIYTYDDFGDVLWNNEPVNEDARREYRNSFAQ